MGCFSAGSDQVFFHEHGSPAVTTVAKRSSQRLVTQSVIQIDSLEKQMGGFEIERGITSKLCLLFDKSQQC